MRTKQIRFTQSNLNKLWFTNQKTDGSTNKDERNIMKHILQKAILSELTEKQRYCIMEYYFNNRKQKEIAEELGINISTVSRHIDYAKKKLQNIASYYSKT